MEDASGDVCAICLGGLLRGQANFTAECSHAFHFSCISASVAHGNHDCPLCKAHWTVLPAVNNPLPATQPAPFPFRHQTPPARRTAYNDDDETSVQAQAAAADLNTNGGLVVLKTHCECPALARGAPRDSLAVLVHAKALSAAAAGESARAPLDLVAVLDTSGSMTGRKLELLKQAMGFVIDNMGSADRLSVVSFSSDAARLIRLARMSYAGKAAAKRAVGSLVAGGGTNIGAGLRVAADVLACRRHRNAVAGIMLLSDGQDTYTSPRYSNHGARGRSNNYMGLVPPSVTYTGAGDRPAAVHTFGFGADHDAAAMHTIAEATGGTFSFVENQAVVQDSFAQCIGGLLTVAVQDARIQMACLHPGVRVREVMSGRYGSRVDEDGRAASIDVGELYADEERRFLVFVDVPRTEDTDDVTELLKVSCTYRDAATGQAATVAGEEATVRRPVEVSDAEVTCVEVQRERVRVSATEDMAAAREAADRGSHAEAAQILRSRLRATEALESEEYGELEAELHDFIGRVEDEREYEHTGRACLLSGIGSHAQQRASTRQVRIKGSGHVLQSARKGTAYATPAMEKMVKMSREQRQAAPPPKRKSMGSSRNEKAKRTKKD